MRDLVAAIFPRVKTLNVFLAYSEILGFLMYLEDTERVEKLVERNARPLPARAGLVTLISFAAGGTARWPMK